MSHVTHRHESCPTKERVMSHKAPALSATADVTRGNESCHAHNESRPTKKPRHITRRTCSKSHVGTSHVTQRNTSRPTIERDMSHTAHVLSATDHTWERVT